MGDIVEVQDLRVHARESGSQARNTRTRRMWPLSEVVAARHARVKGLFWYLAWWTCGLCRTDGSHKASWAAFRAL